jgi:hypothetical protein
MLRCITIRDKLVRRSVCPASSSKRPCRYLHEQSTLSNLGHQDTSDVDMLYADVLWLCPSLHRSTRPFTVDHSISLLSLTLSCRMVQSMYAGRWQCADIASWHHRIVRILCRHHTRRLKTCLHDSTYTTCYTVSKSLGPMGTPHFHTWLHYSRMVSSVDSQTMHVGRNRAGL